MSALRYRASFPDGSIHDYAAKPLPVIFLFHAGGYKECPDFDDGFMTFLRMEFARKAFICVSVGYRTGRLQDPTNGINLSTQQQFAIYRAQQDGRGILRSFMRRNLEDQHDNSFTADTNQVFVGGASAGSALAMGLAYYEDQGMINDAIRSASTSDLDIEGALGSLNEDFYYGDPEDDLPVIRGVLNCWGGILIPQTYNSDESVFFQPVNDPLTNPPVIGFVGAGDNVIPFYDDPEQFRYFSKTAPFKSENFCMKDGVSGTYRIKKQPGMSPTIYTTECSSLNIYNMLHDGGKLDRFAELYIDCAMGHGLDPGGYNFGVSGDMEAVQTYIAQRAAVFFQAIMIYNAAHSFNPPHFGHKGRSYFRNCLNYRICTDTAENHACGTSGMECTDL